MDAQIIALIAVAVVAVVAIGAWSVAQRRRSQRLQEQFGPEYERTVDAAGGRREAESVLEARQERVEALEIRPLEPEVTERFSAEWREVQARFVDDPAGAVDGADRLIGEVMRARGYPVGNFDQRAADVSVDHPQVLEHYRTAHAIAARQRTGKVVTEDLRQAMIHYRALFADLLESVEQTDTDLAAPSPGRP